METKIFKNFNLLCTLSIVVCSIALQGCAFNSLSANKVIKTSAEIKEEDLVSPINIVVIQKNNLLSVPLDNTKKSHILDKGGTFSRPLISPGRNLAAYLKNNDLYISSNASKPIKVSSNIDMFSFVWRDADNLLYSPSTGGIYAYNIQSNISKPYIKNEYTYENMTLNSKGQLYAEKYRNYKKDGSDYRADYGIIFLDPNTQEEKLLIKSIPSEIDTSGGLGMYPVIIRLSNDNKFLYIWKHPHSGSMAADGVEFSAYDITNNKLMEYKTPVIALPYRDNLSPNPINSTYSAFIYGAGREMSADKNLVLLDVLNGSFKPLLGSNITAMTPYYLEDGNTILYASSKAQPFGSYNTETWLSTGTHHIYSINTETQKITMLTNNPDYFDFSPIPFDNDILFFRYDSKHTVSLWKLCNGKEILLADSLLLYDENYDIQNYYGHFNTELYTNIAN